MISKSRMPNLYHYHLFNLHFHFIVYIHAYYTHTNNKIYQPTKRTPSEGFERQFESPKKTLSKLTPKE